MATADDFIWAILEAPDEDTPRLVFADWLTDQGEEAHAEFIRLQCRLAVHPQEDEQWLAWKVREEELWGVLRERWQGLLAELRLQRLTLANFRRGFVNRPIGLRLTEDVLARGDDRWTFFLQIDSLQPSGVGATSPAFFASRQLARVVAIDCERSGVNDDALAPLATSPHLGRLRKLGLFRNHTGPAGAAALAACPSLTGLTELILDENNELRDAGLAALVASPLCRTLTTLTLFETNLSDAGVIALAGSPHLGKLEVLNLTGNLVGEAGVNALAESTCMPSLRQLILGGFHGRTGWTEACRRACDTLYRRLGAGFEPWEEYHDTE
jgi:uncharacterized protein (TIGR02996 family)